ncbi:MAG: hypothetical protein PHC97_03155 [Patescibacteria group bacterium]|nr:hypothetical protein [Patescibacteria group bacterium]
MAVKLFTVAGDQYRMIDRKMREIKRELDQKNGSPLDPEWVARELQKIIEGKPCETGRELFKIIADWQKFYKDVYGLEADFSSLLIPEHQNGFDRLIIVVPGMTPQRLYDKCKEMFPCQKWTDLALDKIVTSARTAQTNAYAVWFRDRIEADKELKNLSANTLKKRGIIGITLEERLLCEQKYFLETNKHLDINNVTLCSGSRYDAGDVPGVGWLDSELDVGWYNPGHCSGSLRARAAVL